MPLTPAIITAETITGGTVTLDRIVAGTYPRTRLEHARRALPYSLRADLRRLGVMPGRHT